MLSQYSDSDIKRAYQTFESLKDTINQLIDWNNNIKSTIPKAYSSELNSYSKFLIFIS